MHKSFPFQCIFCASLPTFREGVHCTKVLHPLTHAVRTVRAVQCAVCFGTLLRLCILRGGGSPALLCCCWQSICLSRPFIVLLLGSEKVVVVENVCELWFRVQNRPQFVAVGVC